MISMRQLLNSFVVNDAAFDDALAKLNELASDTKEKAQRLDEAMCLNCGPNKPMLRRMSVKLQSVRTKTVRRAFSS